jgi:hypothetical protein
MKLMNIVVGVAGTLAAVAVGSAHAATAAPMSGTAADVVKALQDQGYTVQFNGTANGPLSNCGVTGVHGQTMMMTMAAANPGTVYVDLSCPSSNN